MQYSTEQAKAYHEAGHAVALRYYKVKITTIGIEPSDSDCQSIRSIKGLLYHKEYLEITPILKKRMEEFMCVVMAGIIAEKKFASQNDNIDTTFIAQDEFIINKIAKWIYANESEEKILELKTNLYHKTEQLFTDKNGIDTALWNDVKLVAEKLLEKKMLYGGEFLQLITESAMLGHAQYLKLSKSNKTKNIVISNPLESIEVFVIQINSHFGKKIEEWKKVADNLYIDFYSKRTNPNSSILPDRIFLSFLSSNQVQPVFNLFRRYPIGNSISSGTNLYDTIEIVVGELTPIADDYEITIIYDKHF